MWNAGVLAASDYSVKSSFSDWIARASSCLAPRGRFAKNVTVLVGGAAGSQLVLAAASPLLTRLYTPADFGLWGVFVSLLGLFSVISSLRYELALPLPEDDVEAANIAVLCCLLVVVMAALSAVLVFFLGQPIAMTLGVPGLRGALWLLPIGVLFGGGYSVASYWAVRKKDFSSIARTKLLQSLANVALQSLAFKLGAVALMGGQVVGQSAGAVSLARRASHSEAFKYVSWRGILEVSRKYRRFPFFSTWDGLANTAGTQLPPVLFAAMFGAYAAGLYTLAHRILMLPVSLVGGAVGQVFLSEAAEAHREGRLHSVVIKIYRWLASFVMLPAVVVVMFGPTIFHMLFGEEWKAAGEFARWMMPWVYLVFVTSPLSSLLAVTGRLRQGMFFQLTLLGLRASAILLGAWIGNLTYTVILFAAVSAVCWVWFLFWVVRVSGGAASAVWRPTLHSCMISVALLSPLIGMQVFNVQNRGAWFVAIAVTAVGVGFRYWRLSRKGVG